MVLRKNSPLSIFQIIMKNASVEKKMSNYVRDVMKSHPQKMYDTFQLYYLYEHFLVN